MKVRDQRKNEANERQKEYSSLSVKEKIAILDKRLGVGIGAAKERKRLSEAASKAVSEEPKKAKR